MPRTMTRLREKSRQFKHLMTVENEDCEMYDLFLHHNALVRRRSKRRQAFDLEGSAGNGVVNHAKVSSTQEVQNLCNVMKTTTLQMEGGDLERGGKTKMMSSFILQPGNNHVAEQFAGLFGTRKAQYAAAAARRSSQEMTFHSHRSSGTDASSESPGKDAGGGSPIAPAVEVTLAA